MTLLPVEDALTRLLADAGILGTETVELAAAPGRILAAPVAATLTQPPFDGSAMDGYALRAADAGAAPATLTVIGESAAGRGYAGSVGPGQAVRIFTGAPLPAAADTIAIQEDCDRAGDRVTVRQPAKPGDHIRRRGSDFTAGQILLEAGRALGAREITLAAAMGHPTLTVARKPVVAILATGDELVTPGTKPAADQIVCSNTYGVAAMVGAAGGEARLLGIAGDTRGSLDAHVDAATGADILVTIGGASVGDHDLIGPVLNARGMKLDFWKIAMRPGKPMLYGRLGAMRVLGLPGNPVSSLVCARLFLMPLVEALSGRPAHLASGTEAVAAVDIEANGPRAHYMRATIERRADGTQAVRPVRSQDSSLLSPLAAADCLLVRPVNAPAVKAGGRVQILPMDF